MTGGGGRRGGGACRGGGGGEGEGKGWEGISKFKKAACTDIENQITE